MNILRSILSNVELGEPVVSGSVFMFPMIGAEMLSTAPLTFDEGLSAGIVQIAETSESGSVPELVVRNGGSAPLFLLDGEQVLGLKQNRTFNLSMLLPPVSSTLVPVSCLENGRWFRTEARPRAADHVHFAKGRANKLRSVGRSLAEARGYASDQGMVWADIEQRLELCASQAETRAEADIYADRREAVERAASQFTPQAGQIGALFGAGDRLIGVDLFGSSELYRALSPKLLRSYLVDSLASEETAIPPKSQEAFELMKGLLDVPLDAFPSPGMGQTMRFERGSMSGAVLAVDDKCIHAVALMTA